MPHVPVAVTFKSGFIFADSTCACAQIIEMENSCEILPRDIVGFFIETNDDELIIIDEDCGGPSQNVMLKTWDGIAGDRILTIVGNCTKHVFKKVVENFYKENAKRICFYKDKALFANGLWLVYFKVTQEYWKEIWEKTALRHEKIYLYFSQPKDNDTVTFLIPKETAYDGPDSYL